jgi:hypothetical protein
MKVSNIDTPETELEALRAQLNEHRQALLSSLLISAWMVEARDPYTGGHLWRVARMTHALALELGLPLREASQMAMAGFLHDLGKVGVPDAVLRKPGRLTDEEFAQIRTHPRLGASMIEGHPFAPLIVGAIRHHHEMPNGKGYPMGLKGEDIPLDARLVGLCDAFDAMTSTRPYRKGMPIDAALNIIESELGRQFDAEIGSTFVHMGRAGAFHHIVGHSDDGVALEHCPVCGPTLVRTRHTHAGDHQGCPSCLAQFRWEAQGDKLTPVQTAPLATAEELEPRLDRAQVEALVLDWAAAVVPAGQCALPCQSLQEH